MTSKSSDLARIGLAYVVALLVAAGAALALPLDPMTLQGALVLDVIATVVIFVFSLAWRNSSAYDAYWSVAPVGLVAVWASFGGGNPWRIALVSALVLWWGVRLTYSWARGWTGMAHEDWRYVDLRAKSGRLWPLVNFGGIHLFPTLQVFAGLLPVHAALTLHAPLGVWDGVAVAVTGSAILLEQVSDRQLHDFRTSKPAPGTVLNTGVWSYSRHPNYVGETFFWWGLVFFSLAAGGEAWRMAGALAISLMFRFISIPMIETRHRARRPNYDRDAARGVFLPRALRAPSPPNQ